MLWLPPGNRSATVAQARELLFALTDSIDGELDDRIAGTAQLLSGLSPVRVIGNDGGW